MHIIRTFILRLLVDPAEPTALRGVLQPVSRGDTQPFSDEAGLLALLRKSELSVQDLPSHQADAPEGETP